MKIPAIRANIGIWIYYVAVMSFAEINERVKKVDNELHKSKALSDMIQRSITDNYLSIKEYILNQEERFFNALVLAVYEGEPRWIEVELNYKDEEFFSLGFLEFTGKERIFPVDGQHRVEGIKSALKENPELGDEKVPVIFIGHRNTAEGMEKTRRLFSTLNRYAKPVQMNDIIALDEDDIAAIVTRYLVENCELFSGERIAFTKQKQIPDKNKSAFTSIITLYQCNYELLRYHLSMKDIKRIQKYIKIRPSDAEIEEFKTLCVGFWEDFSSNIETIREYLQSTDEHAAKKWRNSEGGCILFRPIGLLPFIMAAIDIKKRKSSISFKEIFTELNKVNMILNREPWKQVLWSEYEKKMLGSDNQLVKSILIYLVDPDILTEKELNKMERGYLTKTSSDISQLQLPPHNV